LLFIKLILLLVNFSRTIRATSVYSVVYALFLVYVKYRHEWGTSVLARGACVKVADCCDLSSAGMLTRVSSLEHIYECVLPLTAHSLQ
jgi:hypothetical protein